MIEYVELEVAKAATGVRMVVVGLVPSPWSEAAKGLFRLAKIPALAVRTTRDNTAIYAWTGVENAPVVLVPGELPRTSWSAITGLASRLAGPDRLLPADPRSRAQIMGLLELVAGEDGIGWVGRHAMIEASLACNGESGFPLPLATRLAERYGRGQPDRARMAALLAVLDDRLAEQAALGHLYLGGATPNALDVYAATFLTPLSDLPPEECPMLPRLRAAFGYAHAAFGDLVSPELAAHRRSMLHAHLGVPIAL